MAMASSRRHKSLLSRYGRPRLAPKCRHSLSPRAEGPSNVASYIAIITQDTGRRRKGSSRPVVWVTVARVASFIASAPNFKDSD